MDKMLRRKIKTLQQKVRRQQEKINNLNDALHRLEEKELITQDVNTFLRQN